MTRVKPLLISFSLLAFAGAPLYAAGSGTSQTQAQPGVSKTTPGFTSAHALIGKVVVNPQGEDLGEIQELVLDLRTGRVHAAVLGFGGLLGLGEKQYAFPARRLTPGVDRDRVILNVEKSALESAQGFEKDRWPSMDDSYWTKIGRERDAAAGASGGKPALMRASELIGRDVQDQGGKDFGEVKDVVVNLVDGRIRHFVVERDAGATMNVQPKSLSAGRNGNIVIARDK